MKTKAGRLLLVFAILLLGAGCGRRGSAPPATGVGDIKGQVVAQDTGGGLEGATVSLLGASVSSVVTGSDGKFFFTRVPEGLYTVEILREGYQRQAPGVEVKAGQVSDMGTITMPLAARSRLQRGWEKFKSGDYTGAKTEFEEALKVAVLASERAEAYVGIGWCHKKGIGEVEPAKYVNAIANFEKALETLPGHPDAQAAVVGDYLQRADAGDVDKAIGAGKALLSRQPLYKFAHDTSYDKTDVQALLALAYYYKKDYTNARTHVNSALAAEPDHALALSLKSRLDTEGV